MSARSTKRTKAAEQPPGRPTYRDGSLYVPGDRVTVKASGETGRALYSTARDLDGTPAWFLVVELDEVRPDGRRSTTALATRFVRTT